MSYILDALARTHAAHAEIGLRTLSKRSFWQQIAIGLLLMLVVMITAAYLGVSKKQPAKAAEEVAAAPPAPQASANVAEVPSMAARPARPASAPSAPTSTTTARPASNATNVAAVPVAAASQSSAQLPARSGERAEPRFQPPTALSQRLPDPSPRGPGGTPLSIRPPPAATTSITRAAAAEPRPLALADIKPTDALTPQARSALEQMKVEVLFHTAQRRNRFVMIDNREVREGDELYKDVRLEEITDTGLIVRHKNILVLVPALASR